jgi:hypothetical protein
LLTWWIRRKAAKKIGDPCWSDSSELRKSPQFHHRSPHHMCQPRAKFCKVLLASGSTRSIHAGCSCRVLWRAIQWVPPRSPTCSWKNSGKCNTGLRYCKNKYSFLVYICHWRLYPSLPYDFLDYPCS